MSFKGKESIFYLSCRFTPANVIGTFYAALNQIGVCSDIPKGYSKCHALYDWRVPSVPCQQIGYVFEHIKRQEHEYTWKLSNN